MPLYYAILCLLFSVLTALISTPALADDPTSCGFIDESINLGPVRDQFDVGWCFANTAADVLKHAYLGDFGDSQVSSTFVALNYFFTKEFKDKKNINSIFNNSGVAVQAIEYIANNPGRPICLQTVDDKMHQRSTNMSLAQKLDFFREQYNDYQIYIKETNPELRNKALRSLLQNQQKIIQTKGFLSLFDENILLNALAEPTLDEAVMSLLNVACEKESKSITHTIKFNNYFTSTRNSQVVDASNSTYMPKDFSYLDKINKALDNKKIIGFVYKMETVVADKNQKGVHVSSIIGRQYNDKEKKCYYKVRNSWGTNCRRGIIVRTLANGESITEEDISSPPVYEDGIQCDGGNFWLTSDKISQIVEEIFYAGN